MDRGAWRATVPGVTKSQSWMKKLSMYVLINCIYMSVPTSQFISPIFSSLVSIIMFVLYIYVSVSALKIKLSIPILSAVVDSSVEQTSDGFRGKVLRAWMGRFNQPCTQDLSRNHERKQQSSLFPKSILPRKTTILFSSLIKVML